MVFLSENLRASRETGQMGARECLRNEMPQSLTCAGGQGARAHDMRASYSAWRVTELNKGLGVAVKNEDAKLLISFYRMTKIFTALALKD